VTGPPSFQPPSVRPPRRPSRGYTGFTLLFSALAALMLGVIIGVGIMWIVQPGATADDAADAGAAGSPPSDASDSAEAEASASPTASASEKPAVDPAAAARAQKLAALRKKVKGRRASQLDAQCKRFKETMSTGYVYDGGTFEENQYVANASGCVALAQTTKAPWFCCRGKR
jgi:hypothetical protein